MNNSANIRKTDVIEAPLFVNERYQLDQRQVELYERDGYLIVPGLFSPEEVAPLQIACVNDPDCRGATVSLSDSRGNAQELVCWTAASEDLVGLMPRMARMVRAAEKLIDEPVYHWHSKLSLKRPHSAGQWDWHQDYAYWYNDGCLAPRLLTITIAIDQCSLENGCMQIIPRSHDLGRIDHKPVGRTTAVDPERLVEVQRRYPIVPCLMEVGDALLFHGNTLHASGPNESDSSRTLLHCTYNAVSNAPIRSEGQEDHQYSPLVIASDDVILEHRYATAFSSHPFPRLNSDRKKSRYGTDVLRSTESAPDAQAGVK